MDVTLDYAAARRNMVDGQLRPNRVSDPRVVSAMRELPRERFLPPTLRVRAYLDEDVPLGGGRVLMEPLIISHLVQLLAVRRGDRGLVLGAGVGFGAALLAAVGARVVAVEDDPKLLAQAREVVPEVTEPGTVTLVHAAPVRGHAAEAPYDVVLIEGEVPEVPREILEQLAEGGRLATVLPKGGRARHAVLIRRVGTSFTTISAFDCATAPLPGFQPAPGFVF